MSTADTQELKETLAGLQKQFQAFAKSQDELIIAVSGNPLDKSDSGMLGELKELKLDVEDLKEERKRWKYWLAGVMAVVVIVGPVVAKYIFKI